MCFAFANHVLCDPDSATEVDVPQFPCTRATVHDHCTAYDLRLGMSNVLTWGWEAAHSSSICSTLTLGWIPEGKEVPGELTPLSQPLGTLLSSEYPKSIRN